MTRSQHEGLMPAPTFTPHRVNVTAADSGTYSTIPKLHGFDCDGWDEIVAQVKVNGADVDLVVLLWSELAGAFVPCSPAQAFSNLTVSSQIRFSTGGQRFFIHVSGTFTRVDIDCAGAL